MKKRTIYVTFASPKGGVGKTTLTMLAASYLYYHYDLNVAIIDCNYPIYTIANSRIKEIERLKSSHTEFNRFLAQRKASSKGSFPIFNSSVKSAVKDVRELRKNDHYDVIFFDMPSLMSVYGTSELLTSMNIVIFPIIESEIAVDTTARYIDILNEHIITTGKATIKEMHLLRNMIFPMSGFPMHEAVDRLTELSGVSLMESRLKYTKMSLLPNTVSSPKSNTYYKHILKMVEELNMIMEGVWNE